MLTDQSLQVYRSSLIQSLPTVASVAVTCQIQLRKLVESVKTCRGFGINQFCDA
jgi:hypothetical protein